MATVEQMDAAIRWLAHALDEGLTGDGRDEPADDPDSAPARREDGEPQ